MLFEPKCVYSSRLIQKIFQRNDLITVKNFLEQDAECAHFGQK